MIRTEGGHFWITFDNGYTISVFNGFGSYTENHFNAEKMRKIMDSKNPYLNSWESKTVEIAIIKEDLGFVTQNIIDSDDSVKAVDVNELVEIINKVSKLRS